MTPTIVTLFAIVYRDADSEGILTAGDRLLVDTNPNELRPFFPAADDYCAHRASTWHIAEFQFVGCFPKTEQFVSDFACKKNGRDK